ncbi:MAG TPA: phage tail protein [Candidatus Mucispirillum faecigallinarum]|uniref:Phage tail protein n=1 Tax=Candidatus Mucispirillum faecigallinarum TaxID=2838699 RepID=A0A9D2GTW6_9BACT|nr:phage tail protein [Candidatus Mucispirillum faecigallinarum]
MAGYKYFTVLTDKGKELLAEAIANETTLDFTEMAVGDSNGISYNPTSDMTALKHVTYRAAIGSMRINAKDKNIMEFEFVVPASVGGFYIREAGLYSSDGTLIAISRLPEQYKADMAEGAGSSMTVRMYIAISSDAQIYITVPASITYATQTYVIEEFKKHKADSNPHVQYVLNEIYSAKIDELQEDINSKAANTHNHDSTYLKKTDASSTYLNKTDAGNTYATKEALNSGLAGKAASNHTHSNYAANNHNHDSVYSKTNHTHSNYAASSHSHAFSSITGSMDLTDNRLKGLLPISKGGTNSQDGFGWKNAYSDAEFNAKIGLKYPFNTQQLASAIIKLNRPVFCMVYGWRQGERFITDFPGSAASHRTIINYFDKNQFYIETIDPFNLTTYICNVSGGVAGKWIKTRNDDGSIPESLIPATQKVTVADGVTWIETPLSNGKSMLYGIAQKTTTGDGLSTSFWKMIPPKSIDASTIQLKANYLANLIFSSLFINTYGSIIDGGYKNIVVSESFTDVVTPIHNFLLTMQAITA